jgi:aspartate/methionine/tyrosine aminotransferase
MMSGMPPVGDRSLSSLVREQIARPSPIRQIMKMAERQNIVAMGLNPADVISFGGGWVNHPAPDALRQAYREVVSNPALFHESGGYTATLGASECREALATFDSYLFGVAGLGAEHIAIGGHAAADWREVAVWMG